MGKTMAELRSIDHHRIRRMARQVAGARLLYVRVGPRPHVHQELTGWLPQRQARESVRLGFPYGFVVLHSPDLPFFRAIVGVSPFRHRVVVDAEAWVSGPCGEGPYWFHDRSERMLLRAELRMVELLLWELA